MFEKIPTRGGGVLRKNVVHHHHQLPVLCIKPPGSTLVQVLRCIQTGADKFTGITTIYKVKNWWLGDIWLGEPDIADPGLKDIQCWRVHNLRQSIPETDGVREELAFHQGGTGGRNFELIVVASCFFCWQEWFDCQGCQSACWQCGTSW